MIDDVRMYRIDAFQEDKKYAISRAAIRDLKYLETLITTLHIK